MPYRRPYRRYGRRYGQRRRPTKMSWTRSPYAKTRRYTQRVSRGHMVKTFVSKKELAGFNCPAYPGITTGQLKFDLGSVTGNSLFPTYGSMMRVKTLTAHIAPTYIEAGNSVEYALILKRLRASTLDKSDSAFDESGAVVKTMFFQTLNKDTGYDPKNQLAC